MKNTVLTILIISVCFVFTDISAQQWGLYTLCAPINSTQTYLIDTNGTTYKTWSHSSSKKTGFSVYLLPGDTLIRPVSYQGNVLSGGGMTGELQIVLWDGTVVWDWVYSTSAYCLHHDVCPMPNGNILMTCYEVKSGTDAINAGCSQNISIWSEKLIEVRPTSATTGDIVWEWHLWDHLCQNYDPAKPNYVTSISDNPQLMNINFNTAKDWIHMNGIDYNPTLDQITFSSRPMNEIYVIDHSTTTAEAASHTGGNSGKGGDILYRWGNPIAYGITGTKVFNVVHDSHWIPGDNPNYPNYLCAFNNAGGAGNKSCIDIINPPYNGYNYDHTPGTAFLPATYAYRHTSTLTSNSNGASQQLPNGNMLICISTSGYLYEINSAGTSIWNKTISAGQPANAIRYEKCYVRGPRVVATASDNQVCPGDQVTLNATGSSVTEVSPVFSYAWSSGQNTQSASLNPTVPETYTVTITDSSVGCTATATVSVNVYPQPTTPVVTENGGTLSSTSAVAYQWFLNSSVIPGANGQTHTPAGSGDYQVQTADANGCFAMSDVYSYSASGIKENSRYGNLKVYPNPNESGIFNIETTVNNGNSALIRVYDVTGRKVFEDVFGTNNFILNLSGFSAGLYTLIINTEDQSGSVRIVITEVNN